MPVQLLSSSVVSKIAAGEVIERPGSVVKELVENALDAGATEITVELTGGGARLIRVQDNGCGLPPDEVPLAFQRHATSKIQNIDDLLRVESLGFRGEALPSIAAVAEVTFVTRAAGGDGFIFQQRGERILKQSAWGAAPGTSVTVQDLFSEVPARRKFLRAPATEAAYCVAVVSQYALARPDVRFSVLNEGKRVLQSPGKGALRDAAAAVLGGEVAAALLELAPEEAAVGNVRVSGLVSPPGVTRSSRTGISLFINGRWVQNRSLTYAVEEAYQGALMTGRHPVAVLHLRVPPAELDVNIHPRKLEVRFVREGEVFVAVQRAVRHTLTASAPAVGLPGFMPSGWPAFPGGSPGQAVDFQRALMEPQSAPPAAVAPSTDPPAPRRVPLLRVVGQLSGTYIITEAVDGLYLVDQHAAHERVRFERVLQRLQQEPLDHQGLLDPALVELAAEEIPLLAREQATLERYGLLFEPFGERHVLVRALPAGVRVATLREFLAEVLAGLRAGEGRQERLATSIACHSAVRAGDTLTLEEMRRLLEDLEGCAAPHTCPHGRPTMLHMSTNQLEREFGRRG